MRIPDSLKDNMESTPSLWQENYNYHKNQKYDLDDFLTERYKELHNIYTVVYSTVTYYQYKQTVKDAMEQVQTLKKDGFVNWEDLSSSWNEAMNIKRFLMKTGAMGGNSWELKRLNKKIKKLKL